MQSDQIRKRHTAAISLIRERRIGKAVADNPKAALQRGVNQPLDMVAARGVKQKSLGNGIPTFVAAVEQQPADRFRPCRPARLPRALNRDAGALERCGKELQLGRFSGPLPAFEGNKATARRRVIGGLRRRRPAQRLLPQIQFPAAIVTRPKTPMRSTLAAA